MTKPNPDYSFYVKPLSELTNEEIARTLNALGDAAFTAEVQAIEVDGVLVKGVYLVPHSMLTALERSTTHRHQIRAYAKEGEGKVRLYVNYKKVSGRLARTKPVSAVKRQIAALKKG